MSMFDSMHAPLIQLEGVLEWMPEQVHLMLLLLLLYILCTPNTNTYIQPKKTFTSNITAVCINYIRF